MKNKSYNFTKFNFIICRCSWLTQTKIMCSIQHEKIVCFCVENGWKKCDFCRLVHGKGMPMTHGGPEIRILDLLSFTCTKTHHLRSVEPSKQPINSTRRRKSGVSLKKCILVHHNYGVLNQNPVQCSGCINHFL